MKNGWINLFKSLKFKMFKPSRSNTSAEARMNCCKAVALCSILFALVSERSGLAAETLDQLIAAAKKESELTFIAGAQTFGGPKTLAVLEAAFNKRFGLNMKIRFAAGPEMHAMAAR